MGTLQEELEIAAAALKPKAYVPAILTKHDITESIPEVALLVVGNDDRVTAALANCLRTFVEQYLAVPTVALGNLQEADNFVDYNDLREQFHDQSRDDQNQKILDEVESVWEGMCYAYPAITRGQMRIGVEIVKGDVSLTKEVRHTAHVSIGKEKVVDQILTTIYP
jgi:hypothetical protein